MNGDLWLVLSWSLLNQVYWLNSTRPVSRAVAAVAAKVCQRFPHPGPETVEDSGQAKGAEAEAGERTREQKTSGVCGRYDIRSSCETAPKQASVSRAILLLEYVLVSTAPQ